MGAELSAENKSLLELGKVNSGHRALRHRWNFHMVVVFLWKWLLPSAPCGLYLIINKT